MPYCVTQCNIYWIMAAKGWIHSQCSPVRVYILLNVDLDSVQYAFPMICTKVYN